VSASFLFLSARPEKDAVEPEYEAVRRTMALTPHQLHHHPLVDAPLADLPLSKFRGIVVGGSPFNVSTEDTRKSLQQRRVETDLARLAEWAVTHDARVVFTCYGIGVLTRVLGGAVDTAHGEAAAAVEVTLTDAGTSDPLTGALPGTFQALVGHKESTSVLPNSAVLLATSVGCPVQIYRVGSHVYATQFHPEVSPEEFIARSRVYRNHGYFRADELSAVIERLTAASVTEPQRLLRRFAEAALQDVPD